MSIIIYNEEKFTDEAKANLEHFIYYIDGKAAVGALSERCAVYADGELSEEEALDSIRGRIKDALSGMPDFGAYVMDDGCGLVYLNGIVNALIEKEVVGDLESIPFEMAYEYRVYCQEAAEEGEIIALYLPEDI